LGCADLRRVEILDPNLDPIIRISCLANAQAIAVSDVPDLAGEGLALLGWKFGLTLVCKGRRN